MSRLHRAVEGLVISLIACSQEVDNQILVIHIVITLSMRKSYKLFTTLALGAADKFGVERERVTKKLSKVGQSS
jgi:hypothetical protein